MTSTAVSTGTSSSSSLSSAKPTTSSACGTTLYDIPVQDAACAMPYGGNHTTLMLGCCGGDADVVSYAGDCGLYCRASGQSVDDLTACLYGAGAAWEDVFCRGNGTATATATGADATALPSGASVVTSDSSGSKKTSSGSSDSSSSSETGSASSAAAGRAASGLGITMGGVTVSVVLASGFLLGALQL